jgi:hypothetical protein
MNAQVKQILGGTFCLGGGMSRNDNSGGAKGLVAQGRVGSVHYS